MQPLLSIILNVIGKQENHTEMKTKKKTPVKNLWSQALNDAKHDWLVECYSGIWHEVLFVPQRTENTNRTSDPTLEVKRQLGKKTPSFDLVPPREVTVLWKWSENMFWE